MLHKFRCIEIIQSSFFCTEHWYVQVFHTKVRGKWIVRLSWSISSISILNWRCWTASCPGHSDMLVIVLLNPSEPEIYVNSNCTSQKTHYFCITKFREMGKVSHSFYAKAGCVQHVVPTLVFRGLMRLNQRFCVLLYTRIFYTGLPRAVLSECRKFLQDSNVYVNMNIMQYLRMKGQELAFCSYSFVVKKKLYVEIVTVRPSVT